MTTTKYNTNENVKLVNNTTLDHRKIPGAYESFLNVIENNAPMHEAFEDIFTLKVITRPSGSKYGILEFA